LREAYLGPEGVLTGSARLAQEAKERAAERARLGEIEKRKLQLDRKRKALDSQIASLRVEVDAEEAELQRILVQEKGWRNSAQEERAEMEVSRRSHPAPVEAPEKSGRGGRKQ
jgi:circadian clock protein KaiC